MRDRLPFVLFAALGCACSPFGDDECSVTLYPVEEGQLTTGRTSEGDLEFCPTVGYRQQQYVGLDVVPGDCKGTPDYNWSLPEGTVVQGDLNRGSASLQFAQGGEVCVFVENGSHETPEVCKPLTVSREDVWGRIQEEFLKDAAERTVLFSIGTDLFLGFGTKNRFYRLDTVSWTWDERAGVADFVDFQAPAGFVARDVAYIVGRNSILYSYDPGVDRWSAGADIQIDEVLVDVPSLENNATGPLFGLSEGDRGYVGLSAANGLLIFDAHSGNWSESSAHPSPTTAGGTPFVLGGKIYVGSHVFDPAQDSWAVSPVNFDTLGAVAVVGSAAYYIASGSTQRFDGTTVTSYTPRTQALCQGEGFPSEGPFRSVTVDDVAFMISADLAEGMRFYVPE